MVFSMPITRGCRRGNKTDHPFAGHQLESPARCAWLGFAVGQRQRTRLVANHDRFGHHVSDAHAEPAVGHRHRLQARSAVSRRQFRSCRRHCVAWNQPDQSLLGLSDDHRDLQREAFDFAWRALYRGCNQCHGHALRGHQCGGRHPVFLRGVGGGYRRRFHQLHGIVCVAGGRAFEPVADGGCWRGRCSRARLA